MNLLAIDTSTELASLALLIGDEMTSEEQPSLKTHAQTVLPLIDRLLRQADVSLAQLDGIVFGCGPGSFTGLRIACSIAKGLACAHDLPLIPVSSLAAMAYEVRQQAEYAQAPILAVLDARMQELYWAYFAPGTLLAEDRLNAAADIKVPATPGLVITGTGIEEYWPDLSKDLQSQIHGTIPAYPKAAAMIRLAVDAGIKPVAAAKAQPVYVRNQVTQGDSRG